LPNNLHTLILGRNYNVVLRNLPKNLKLGCNYRQLLPADLPKDAYITMDRLCIKGGKSINDALDRKYGDLHTRITYKIVDILR